MIPPRRAILCCGLALLAACTSAGLVRRPEAPAIDYRSYAGDVIEDFHFFRMDGWEVVGPSELLLWTGLGEAYWIKVWEPCTELPFAFAIRVTSRFNRVSRFEKVIAGRDVCPITEIRRIDAARLKADRAKARASARDRPPG